ncbi:MAG: CYTH domain-containing protein, partial [Terrimicrobiaceae bacterium]
MPDEIERKFLVVGDGWQAGAVGTRYVQGYLSRDPERTVRVRLVGDKAFLTIKGISRGISRPEFEYA